MFEKQLSPTQVDLSQPLQIKDYMPNPAGHKAFVFVVDKNITDTVIGVRQGVGIRVPIASATLDPKHPMSSVYGTEIILVDSAYVRCLWMPGRRKELLAALAFMNARIYDDHKWSSPDHSNIANPELTVDEVPERVMQLLDGGYECGFKPAQKAANRQNRIIDKGLKPIVADLHKQKKQQGNKNKSPRNKDKSITEVMDAAT